MLMLGPYQVVLFHSDAVVKAAHGAVGNLFLQTHDQAAFMQDISNDDDAGPFGTYRHDLALEPLVDFVATLFRSNRIKVFWIINNDEIGAMLEVLDAANGFADGSY